jgi:hypothetical protein
MAKEKVYPPLTAYRVYLDNGTNYVTSMAAGVTLKQAREYFMGQPLEQHDGSTATVTNVEAVREPAVE